MRVWIVNQYAVPPSEPGGLRPFALAKELRLAGHDVTLVASSFNHWTRRETRLSEGRDTLVEDVEGVRFAWHRTPAYPGSTVKRYVSMLSFAAAVANSPVLNGLDAPDVVVGSNPHLFGAYAAERLADRHDAAFVFEVRDIWPQSLVEMGRLSPRHPAILVMQAIEDHLCRRAGSVVTLPPAATDYFVSKGLDRAAVFPIPNGVYLPDLPAPSPLPHNEVYTVVFAGIHGVANGLDTVLDAAALLREAGLDQKVKFRLIGDGGEKPRLVERARIEGLTNVEFDGPFPKSRISEELARADAGLLILKESPVFRWGVSPNKLFDYFGAARPVIYAVKAANNPVEEADAGVTVTVDDPESLAKGAVSLAETARERLEQMAANGRAYVEERHDLAKLGKVFEAALVYAVESKRTKEKS
ncbi:MAG: glycosyltransferase family 4 protein [Armatimonadetes bacterium]|nr:glycosyltransferase family 4 protein [Armatimonadota bacterium]